MSKYYSGTPTHFQLLFCCCSSLMMMFQRGSFFESARRMPSLASKWFQSFVLMCKSIEKPASHKRVVANGTRTSKALPANRGNVLSRAHQNISSCIFSHSIWILSSVCNSTRSSFIISLPSMESRLKRNGSRIHLVPQKLLQGENTLGRTESVLANFLLHHSRWAALTREKLRKYMFYFLMVNIQYHCTGYHV